MEHASLDNMPIELKEAFLKVTPDTAKLRTMFNKDRERMIAFRDMSDEQIKSINAPTLLISSDVDVVTPEHTVEIHRLIPNSRLTIIPGQHGSYIGEITTLSKGLADNRVPIIEEFLGSQTNLIDNNIPQLVN